MKNLIEYITEKFKINSKTVHPHKEEKYYDKSNYQEAIENLQKLGKENGYNIKFRNRKMNSGDFCIFIYDANKPGSSYLVGYDGDWDAKEEDKFGWTFNKCYQEAIEYIETNSNK